MVSRYTIVFAEPGMISPGVAKASAFWRVVVTTDTHAGAACASIGKIRSAITLNREIADAGTGEPGTGPVETAPGDLTVPQPASIIPASAAVAHAKTSSRGSLAGGPHRTGLPGAGSCASVMGCVSGAPYTAPVDAKTSRSLRPLRRAS